MPKASEKRKAELKAGVFIIAILALLVFSVLWLRYFAVKPEMTIIARFSDPGPVNTGLPVYYQGVNVGRVAKIEFSEDYKYTLIYIEVYQENLKVPANVYAEVRTEGITGQKYIAIIYPPEPAPMCLTDGACIVGKSPFGLTELQAFLERQVRSGRMERIFADLESTLASASQTSKRLDRMSNTLNTLLQANKGEINNFFKRGSEAATDISEIAENINDFVGDPSARGDLRSAVSAASEAAQSIRSLIGDPEITSGIKNAIKGIGGIIGNIENATSNLDFGTGTTSGLGGTINSLNSLLQSMDNFVNNLNCYTGNIYKDIEETNLIPNASGVLSDARETLNRAGSVLDKAGSAIDKVDETDGNTMGLIINTIQNANQAAQNHNKAVKQVDCLAEGVGKMLSKRFLLLKLLFGKPGAELEQCKDLNEYINGDKQAGQQIGPCPVSPTQTPPSQPVKPCPVQTPIAPSESSFQGPAGSTRMKLNDVSPCPTE